MFDYIGLTELPNHYVLYFLTPSLAFPPAAGCQNGCSGHGMCTTVEGQYRCECSAGWTGPDCSVQLETQCSDENDNDGGEYCAELPSVRRSWGKTGS